VKVGVEFVDASEFEENDGYYKMYCNICGKRLSKEEIEHYDELFGMCAECYKESFEDLPKLPEAKFREERIFCILII